MKKILLIVLILSATVQAADTELQDLAELVAIDSSDVFYVVDDPAGAPLSRKITALNLFDMIDTSAELLAILTNETGTGALCFATSPTLVTPILGTITSGVGTALTALNGENIQDDTIDDDSIDWADCTFADFDFETAWRMWHSDAAGDVIEITLGADGTFLESNGAAANPAFRVLADGDVPDTITIDLATLATTVTLADDDATNDNQDIVFTTDAAGPVNLEADIGDFYYNPSTGTVTATEYVGGGAGITGLSVTYENIGDPAAAGSITFQDTETATYITETTATDFFEIQATGAFADISLFRVSQGTGNPTDGALAEFVTADAEDDVDQLLLGNSTDDQVTFRIIEAGTLTIDVISDGTPQTQFSDLVTGNAGITVATTTAFSFGANRIDNGADLIDGEQIGNDTIDNDSIDWGDMTDLDTDGTVIWGNIAEGELTNASVIDADIKDDTIQEPALNTTNAADAGTDDYLLSYNHAGTNFTWVAGGAGDMTRAVYDSGLSGGVDQITTVDSTYASDYVVLTGTAVGTDTPKTDAALTYDATSGTLAATEFSGGGSGLTLASTDLSDTAALLYETELDDFAELDAQIADKALINLADGGTFTGNIIANANLSVGNAAATAGVLTLLEDTDDGAHFASFMVPALAASTIYTLPPDDGDNTEVLQTDGAGTLTWVANAGGGATAWDDIGDPDAAATVDFTTYTQTIDIGVTDDGGPKSGLILDVTGLGAGLTDVIALEITTTANDDTDYIPIAIYDDSGGDNDEIFKIDSYGRIYMTNGGYIINVDDNYFKFGENGDELRMFFTSNDVDLLWSDGALNLRNAEDGVDGIVNIQGKDTNEKGILRVMSDGDDKYIELHHDDTDGHIITNTGDIHIEPAGGDTVFTGGGDFGGADLELPQASPAVPDADGEIELDFTDGTVVIQHGSAHAELGASTDVVVGKLIRSFGATIFAPDGVNDVMTVKAINSIEFPHGIVITAIYLGVSSDDGYVLTVQNFDDFDTINGANPTIDTVTYSADTTGEIIDTTPTYATIGAGQIIMVSIPATNVDWIHFEIYYYEPAA